MARFEFLEKEDVPFAKDLDSWSLFRMKGSDPSKWVEIEDSDSCVRIESQASVISEAEAKSLADALARERGEA
ncbi:MAG: hypothetical protein K9M96_01780 [Deltaproteobacteria bacterium]|nr:hypothetical protein [Deltaproteobacteria bacterium]